METITKWIAVLAPFLATYPIWVKVLFAFWVAVGAILFVSLIFTKPPTTSTPTAAPSPTPNLSSFKQVDGTPMVVAQVGAEPKDIWMVIEGLEFYAAREGAQVRVFANVNGTEFTYPSLGGVEWLEVGPSMSAQVFRLPPTRERYTVRFHADVRVPARPGKPGATGKLTSVKEDIVNVANHIPFTGRYVLHTFDRVHMARSADASAELRYRITYDPK